MATYYVSHEGDNGSGLNWANAKTTLTAALALASSDGDLVLVDKDHIGDAALSSATIYTALNNISIIVVDKDGGDALASMSLESAYIGSASNAVDITFNGGYRVLVKGLAICNAGTLGTSITMGGSDNSHYELQDCYFKLGTTSSGARIACGSGSSGYNTFTMFSNCTFDFANVFQRLALRGRVMVEGGGLAGSVLQSGLLDMGQVNNGQIDFHGFDLYSLGANYIIGGAQSGTKCTIRMIQCKLGASYVVMDTGTVPLNASGTDVFLIDCHSGDTHGVYEHYNQMGSTKRDTSIYLTAGASGSSWRIETSANVSRYTPYRTPWISKSNAVLSGMTPTFQILRNGSATAYTNAAVWAEFSAKVTSGSTRASFFSDAAAVLGAPANQTAGAGLGAWTGEGSPAWSGACDSGAAFTPTSVGPIGGRICVGSPSTTVYVNPDF